MIYLHNITDAQVLFIPKNGTEVGGDMTLRLRNTLDHEFIVDQVTDLGSSGIYHYLAISLPGDIPDGEYEYTLHDGQESLSAGILVINSEHSAHEYNEEIKYEQYITD